MLSILFLTVATAAAPGDQQQRYNDCTALASRNAEKAITEAETWRAAGGGLLARQCLGLAYVNAERWAPAAQTFEQAARDAEIQHDGRAANLWVQSGNAALANDEPVKAKAAFDRALALSSLSDPMRGEALMDRARANVGTDDPAAARADLDAALKLVPEDPMGWLLSATLARRQKDYSRAEKDINEAARLAPDASAIAYEQGNVAYEQGHADVARGSWQRAISLDKTGNDAGNAARMAIAKLETEAASAR